MSQEAAKISPGVTWKLGGPCHRPGRLLARDRIGDPPPSLGRTHTGGERASIRREGARLPDIGWLLDALRSWGSGREDIAAIALVGSYARGAATPDSDVDLVILTDDPDAYLSRPGWIEQFGEPVTVADEDWGRLRSIRVVYRDELEVEFGFVLAGWASSDPVDEGTRRVASDGLRIILDRRGQLGDLARAAAAPPAQ